MVAGHSAHSIILSPAQNRYERVIMDLKPWLNVLARELQTPGGSPDDHTIRTVLALARDAAHEIERPAAPLTTFLVGVAVGRGATLEAAAGTASSLLLDVAEPPSRESQPG
jgi:Domain of unknown function (DUF6457)